MDELNTLLSAFRERYDADPTVMVRSPGRVNLIGEHTDYSLLPVMPFAIDRGVLLAVGDGSSGVEVDSLTHPGPTTIEIGTERADLNGWHRYFAAAVDALGFVGGAKVLIGGDLPATGGLSSSSAFTVGSLVALGAATGDPPFRDELPELALAAERSIGVESGAMDQTVIALARQGHALRIDFSPFATRHVPLGDAVAVVAAYSGHAAPKGGSAKDAYNSRVVACRAAALILADELGVDPGRSPVLGGLSGADASGLPESMSAEAVGAKLSVPVGLMVDLTAGRFDPDSELPLRQVAQHVLSEARRVDSAEAALEAQNYDELGRLLDASHSSLQSFGASSEALDRLTLVMREAGALGARLTGAGFGGYAIALCDPAVVSKVIEAATAATGGPAFRVRPSDGVATV